MTSQSSSQMRLYSTKGERLYLNASERRAFANSAATHDKDTGTLCQMLLLTGCRLSEALNLRLQDIQSPEGIVAIKSLKKRSNDHVRELPLPRCYTLALRSHCGKNSDQLLWQFSRTTAWRRIKLVMRDANITGTRASPKGLRHSFAVQCAFNNVAMPLTQKWMGHSDIATTAIYYQIIGKEERDMAKRNWL